MTPKFKAITTDGKLVDGQYYYCYDDNKHIINEIIDVGHSATEHAYTYQKKHSIIPETVCQFTGLHDKNGKEIYQGDILNSVYFQNAIVEMWRFGWHVKTETGSYHSFVTANHTFEITGNIHDPLIKK